MADILLFSFPVFGFSMSATNYECGNDVNSHQSLSLSVIYGKKSVGTILDFRHANSASECANIKLAPLLFLSHLRWISKVKVVSFLLGLTLTFIVMASYTLMWDKRRLWITVAPYRVSSAGTACSGVSTEKSGMDPKVLAKMINSIGVSRAKRVPDKKKVAEADSRLFSAIPRQFLHDVKSPCWYEEVSAEVLADPYKNNHFSLRSKSFKSKCEQLNVTFQRSLTTGEGGKPFRLRCLPYFYIIGQPKCGTTDLFHRLLMHPEVKFNTIKEPHWWTRKRFGYIRFKEGFQERFPISDYLDLFDLAAHNIQQGIRGNSSGDQRAARIITGEASASTMWDNQAWSYLQAGGQKDEPPFLVQDFIHTVQPEAKIIIMLRDPVERLYSDYLYFTVGIKSAEDFHHRVHESLRLFQSCLSEASLHSCIYNTSLYNIMPVRLNLGLYFLFLLDWLSVFRKDQLLILRLEDYASDLNGTLQKVFDFLKVGPLSARLKAALTKRPLSNTRRTKDRDLGPMLPATRNILRRFHRPFNSELAGLLNSTAFLWRED